MENQSLCPWFGDSPYGTQKIKSYLTQMIVTQQRFDLQFSHENGTLAAFVRLWGSTVQQLLPPAGDLGDCHWTRV